jgi:hypothetical protein
MRARGQAQVVESLSRRVKSRVQTPVQTHPSPRPKKKEIKLYKQIKNRQSLMLVAHNYNPNYSGETQFEASPGK